MATLTVLQWGFFISGWFAWTVDAIDFFAVSLATSRLAVYFHKPIGTVTLSITLTLLFRPLGALLFGLLSDRYGRKWPLVADLLVIAAFSLGTGFSKTFSTFLAMRSLFGIAMGGIWGLAVSMSLENMPVDCRGLFSGYLQLGYPVGYLMIAAINLNPRVASTSGWRLLFYIGAGFAASAALLRLLLPESTYFVERRKRQRRRNIVFIREVGNMMKMHWALCVYGIIFMTAFNFYSHGSQDLFPTYIQKDKGLSQHDASLITIIGNCGAIAGCAIGGYLSQYLGRRLTIIVMCLFCGAMLPLWLLPDSFAGLSAGAFFVQAGVQGAYGVVPVYLAEISPVAFRAMWPGVAYQIGNMVSSASAQIESTAGEHLKDPISGLPAYGRVSAILIATAAGVLIICCFIGIESHGAPFEQGRAAFEQDGGKDVVEGDHRGGLSVRNSLELHDKAVFTHIEA
ncbi:MFS general substrate transporter [Naematelia encephala]|uniref:MFS general substrate transporter n=1 Tax=Naematelia encephala TaxID=71784 RepID=A0A1Y2APQ3_9TREE|nr:MFS general substrate transporter [Naematelia encephala]